MILSFLFFVLLRNCLILTINYFAAVYPYRNQFILTKNYEFDTYHNYQTQQKFVLI